MRGAGILQIHLLCAKLFSAKSILASCRTCPDNAKTECYTRRVSLVHGPLNTQDAFPHPKNSGNTTNEEMIGSRWCLKSPNMCCAFLTTSEVFSTQAASQDSWPICDSKNQCVLPAGSLREFSGCCGFHLVKSWALVQLTQGMCLEIIPGIKVRGKQGDDLKGASQHIQVRKRTENKSLSRSFIYRFVQWRCGQSGIVCSSHAVE